MKKQLLFLVLMLLPMLASADPVEIDGIYYNLNSEGKIAEVTKKNSSYYYKGTIVIPSYVFYNDIEYSVTSIGGSAFYECRGLTSITIPNSVTSIGYGAFKYCSGLTSITIPNSVTNIDDDAFRYCSGLASITIPNSVISIGIQAFSGTAWYENQPDGLVYAGKVAYKYKGDMPENTKIILNDGTLGICGQAFNGCSSLTSITIPNSVTSIGGGAFAGCTSLTSITIPNSVINIGNGAFVGCSGLTSITIPNSVTSIGVRTFSSCSSLTSITIPNNVTSIGDRAFEGCTGLTLVTIPNSVTSIGLWTFSSCSELTSITIPNSVKSIGSGAFSGCKNLTSVHISDIAVWCNVDFAGYDSNPLMYAHHLYLNDDEVKDLVIPNSVKSIRNFAFINCRGLTSITIPNSVTSIGREAFNSCTGLTSVTIPNSVTSIFNSAFGACSGLKSVHITDITAWCNINFEDYNSNPLTYAHHLYLNDDEVKDLVIPSSVTSIGREAFNSCTGLTSVTIPNSVTSIGYGAFYGCSSLTFITIPNSVTSIGGVAFAFCSGLTSVTIPNSVTSIGESAFMNCSGLTSVTIPNSVTSIGYSAFEDCTGLTSVISEIQDPFEIGYYVFNGAYDTATLMVPAGTKSKYEATNYWNKFANIVEMDLTPVDGGETIDFGDDIDDDTNLDGNIVGDIYFNISSDDGGYNSAEGCIVVSKPTDDTSIGEGQDIFGEDFRDNFTGIVFKVPAGTGTIKVEAQTTGGMVLKVKIGNSEPVSMELDGKLKASFPYNVTKPTFVYIYGGSSASFAPNMLGAPSAASGELKLYGIEVDANATGISNVNVNDNDNNNNNERWYSLDGLLQDKPTQKGVYIHNGKKLVVK